MKRYVLACLTVAAVFGCWVFSVRADDIYPPPWLRGQPNTTYQDWTFATGANPVAPDLGVFNPYGNPTATIYGATWSAFYDNHVGVWTFGFGTNSMNFHIPNAPVANPEKEVWTQITWQSVYGDSPFVSVGGRAASLVLSTPVGNGSWLQNVYETVLPFNPTSEDVIIAGFSPMNFGQVVIDTICIPEPSSLALWAVGAAALMVFRRRR
jgi:hypothetical protein